MNNSDMPAMAVKIKVGNAVRLQAEGLGMNVEDKQYIGLTKREHFAGLAMQAVISNSRQADKTAESVADFALRHANALLAELDKEASA